LKLNGKKLINPGTSKVKKEPPRITLKRSSTSENT